MSDTKISSDIEDIEDFHSDAFHDFVSAILAGTEDEQDAEKWRNSKEGKLAIAHFIAGMDGEKLKADVEDKEIDDFIASLDDEELDAVHDIVNDVLSFGPEDVAEEDLEEGHMTPKDIRLRKIYLRSARGKKALRKYLKKVNRQGYVKDKALSRKRKKEARRRIYHQGQHKHMEDMNKDIDGIQLSEMDAETAAHFWGVLYEFALIQEAFKEEGCENLLEACVAKAKESEGEEVIDPEDGEEQLEEGKEEELCIEVSVADMEKVKKAAEDSECEIIEEDDDEDEEDKEGKEDEEGKEDKEDGEEEKDDDEEDKEEKVLICGIRENLKKFLEALELEGEVEDFAVNLEERTSAAQYMKNRKYAQKPSVKRAKARYMKKYNQKRKSGAIHVSASAHNAAVKAAKNRRQAIRDSLEEQFAASTMFGSLNESESVELKNMVFESIDSILEKSCDRIVEDTQVAMQDYINEEFIPATCEIFESYKEGIVKELYTNVDGFLSAIAEEIVDELSEKNVFVKSEKTAVYEEFVDNLVSLMEERLQIIPEREDALHAAKQKIEEMASAKEEQLVERAKLVDKLEEAKREAYIFKNIPSQLSESMKEKLVDYAKTILVEEEEFSAFAEGFDKAVSDTLSLMTEDVVEEQPIKEDVVAPAPRSVVSEYLSVFERMSK